MFLLCVCVCACVRVCVSYTFDKLPYILGHKSYACLKWPQMKLWTNAQGGSIQAVKGGEREEKEVAELTESRRRHQIVC